MSSLERGTSYELQVFAAVENELHSGSLGLNPDLCSLYHQRGYYSRDREDEIVFDISIELFRAGASRWSLLLLWECKNYGKPVPVDQVEEFFAKVGQVAPANSKALVVAPNSFQAGAIRFATANGISLIRFVQNDGESTFMERIVEFNDGAPPGGRPHLDRNELARALTVEQFSGRQDFWYALSNGYPFYDLRSLLRYLGTSVHPHLTEAGKNGSAE